MTIDKAKEYAGMILHAKDNGDGDLAREWEQRLLLRTVRAIDADATHAQELATSH